MIIFEVCEQSLSKGSSSMRLIWLACWLAFLAPSCVLSFGLPPTSTGSGRSSNSNFRHASRPPSRRQIHHLYTSSDGGDPPLPPTGSRWGGGDDGSGDDSSSNSLHHLAALTAWTAATADTDAAAAVVERLRGGGYQRRRRRSIKVPEASVTNVLLGITAAVYGIQGLFPEITMQGAKMTSKILSGQWYRLVTPLFLHGGAAHLFMNSVSLHNIGPFVEKWFGPQRFLSFYLLSGVGGVVASCLMSPRTPSVGASGKEFSASSSKSSGQRCQAF